MFGVTETVRANLGATIKALNLDQANKALEILKHPAQATVEEARAELSRLSHSEGLTAVDEAVDGAL